MSTEVDERALLRAVAGGDRLAFKQLYTAHLGGLCRYACLFIASPEEAEEIVQEVFVRIWERRDGLPQLLSFKAYAQQVAKNLVADYWRQQKRQATAQRWLRTYPAEPEPSDAALIYQQSYQLAQTAIDRLPQKRKQIFLLRTQEELTLDEIAQQLSISKSVVKKQLYAATDFVKGYLHRHSILSPGVLGLLSLLMLGS
ncbi:MAG: RNA polymerase sigma-70 factor [Hymenobacter sp.]